MTDEEEELPAWVVVATVKIKRTYIAKDHRECRRMLHVDLIRAGWGDVEIKHITSEKVK